MRWRRGEGKYLEVKMGFETKMCNVLLLFDRVIRQVGVKAVEKGAKLSYEIKRVKNENECCMQMLRC